MLAALNHPTHRRDLRHRRGATASARWCSNWSRATTLADRIARGPLPLDEALAIARQIAEALEAAHEKGIVHRDLKPGQHQADPDGTVKVLDFGLAKARSRRRRSRDVSHVADDDRRRRRARA